MMDTSCQVLVVGIGGVAPGGGVGLAWGLVCFGGKVDREILNV